MAVGRQSGLKAGQTSSYEKRIDSGHALRSD